MDSQLKFGAFIPQGWKLEYLGIDASGAWKQSLEIAQVIESCGYDHLWVYDHVETVPRRAPTHVFEAFTTLAAVSQVTSRVKLGQLVTCAAYRNAGVLAKTAACIDVMSGGRLIFGLGAGWYEREYQAYGIEFPAPGARIELLDETLEAVRMLWSQETTTFAGKHLEFNGAYCDPKPLQQLPEIWVGGGGERKTLRVAAKHASHTNWQVGIEQFRHKSEVLAGHCADLGREFASITRTHGPDCRIFATEAELADWLSSPGGGALRGDVPHEQYVANHFVGTVAQVIPKVQAYVDAGCREFVMWFRDVPSTYSIEKFAADVIPNVTYR